MSQGNRRLPLPLALRLAAKIRGYIEPACERIELAGSLRRGMPHVGDIEFVLIPHMETDLFGVQTQQSRLDRRLHELREQSRLITIRSGPKLKTYELGHWPGVTLDLYIVRPESWAVQIMIRTGPKEFAHRMVTHQRACGLLPDTMRIHDGRLWQAANRHEPHTVLIDGRPYELIPTPQERDLFESMGLPFLEPPQRVKLADWKMPAHAAANLEQSIG